tara:strand:- start:415 stop:519 length:105 start_codon:yes stop_codon:yes gene_type:complete
MRKVVEFFLGYSLRYQRYKYLKEARALQFAGLFL